MYVILFFVTCNHNAIRKISSAAPTFSTIVHTLYYLIDSFKITIRQQQISNKLIFTDKNSSVHKSNLRQLQ